MPRVTARTALLALADSLYVFRNGRPEANFAHRISEFRYEDVMGQSSSPAGPVLMDRHVKTAAYVGSSRERRGYGFHQSLLYHHRDTDHKTASGCVNGL